MNNLREFINFKFTYLIVGVSQDKIKWGNRIWKTLLTYGYKAIPVNPKYTEIEGVKCYPTVTNALSTGMRDTVVVTVVPPVVTEKIVEECIKLGVTKIWMQEGSESDQALKRLSAKKIKSMSGKCIVRDGLGKPFVV